METKYGVYNIKPLKLCLVIFVAAIGMNVYGWSVSGTVRNTSGAALSGVSVTVKDSARYYTTTDGNGFFRLETPSAVMNVSFTGAKAYSLQVVHGELRVRCPHDGSLELTMIDCSGRTIWCRNVVPVKGVACAKIPPGLAKSKLFLRIKHADGVEYHSLGSSQGCSIHAESSQKTGSVAAVYPTLIFKKSDYRDTSFIMTAENMSNLTVHMASAAQVCQLPATVRWQSSGILVSPKPDNDHRIASVKDPTIQKFNGKYLLYATVYNTDSVNGSSFGWSMQFIQFNDFSQAAAATPTFMDRVSGFSGYKCAPELVFFEPQNRWYLIWQQQDPAYSTTTTPDKPNSWSAPKPFFQRGIPKPADWGDKSFGYLDYWPICDANNAYLFFTGDDGNVFRIKTSLANFPNEFGPPVVAKALDKNITFEGSSHYKIKGTANTYLHVVEGMGSTGRYFSAWTSNGIEGAWQDYKVGQNDPFMRTSNVTYAPGATDWTNDISHGEFVRENPSMIQELDLCDLRFLYQGLDPAKAKGDYGLLPYRLGLLTLQR